LIIDETEIRFAFIAKAGVRRIAASIDEEKGSEDRSI